MRIGMVLTHPFPPDIRVEKEIRTLTKAGFRLFVLADRRGEEPFEEEVGGATIRRVEFLGWRSQPLRSLAIARDWLYFCAPEWQRAIETFADAYHIDVLHTHDLPVLGPGLRAAERMGLPVVADLHENYPAALQAWHSEDSAAKRLLLWPLLRESRWRKYEGHSVRSADRVVLVVDEARSRIEAHGVSGSRVSVVENTEDVAVFDDLPLKKEILDRWETEPKVSYVGGLGPHRGVDTLIRAASFLRDLDVQVMIVGKGSPRHEARLLREVEGLGLRDCIHFMGWQAFENVRSFITASDVCVVPHKRSPHTESTVPHKLFQYMLCRRAVVVSDCAPLQRIVEEANCGSVFRSDDPEDLAQKLRTLLTDDLLRLRMGENGRRAVDVKYNWERSGSRLVDMYEGLRDEIGLPRSGD
jgi:glycosyltransferase involved in cell wall biosynthesis